MEEVELWQIQSHILSQVGEQLGQIKQKLIESLPKRVSWQLELEGQVRRVSEKIWQRTGKSNDYQDGLRERFDDDGYLLNPEDWSIGVAEHLAKEERVEMTEAHWEVVIFLREYYKEYNTVPTIKPLVKAIAKKLGPEKGNTKYLLELYRGGPAKQASKIAGLPRPMGD